MAKRGGFLHSVGSLIRWIMYALAAVLVVAIWLAWSDRTAPPETTAVAEGDGVLPSQEADSTEASPPEPESASSDESPTNNAEEDSEPAAVAEESESSEATVSDTVADTVQDLMESPAEAAAGEAETEAEEADPAPAEAEVSPSADGAVPDEDADLNILPPELSEIQVPGDSAVYGLVSVFQRDDGSIEVVSSRTADGQTTETVRLVRCAPLSVGVISEGDGPREDEPELERITLGSAAATIAAVACGAMN